MAHSQRENLQERLRRLGLVKGMRALPSSKRRAVAIESLVDGVFHDTPHGQCFVARADFPLDHCHGDWPLAAFLDLAPALLAAVGGEAALAGVDLRRGLFLDTETTGLSGGSGTMAFLVGLGFFDGPRFCLLQPFLRDPGDERAMVHFLEELLPRFEWLITFNGRAFDLPILQTRFVLARRPLPLTAVPHLDLLGPARRLWRERLPSCALGVLEREALGVRRDQADVPSGVIPLIYRDYLRTGDAREISRVLYHNLIDILSMVTLAARLCQAFAAPLDAPGRDGGELYAVARWYASSGGDVEGALRAALAAGLLPALRWRALEELALCAKRSDRPAEALALWQQLAVENPQGILAAKELAKLYEWQLRRPALAAAWTRLALARVERWPRGAQRTQALADLRHRLARLERRLGKQG